ncbi:MAG TPA: AraC family transcriptional regulator [Pyrinomonadaceae bacterium]|jgi:AraC family L-rhamnose operon regulatory protein RhaS|nr:AraC family transcriptional regulator [Pyrinomonadaceae bacterium]
MAAKGKRKRPHQHHFTELGIYVFESRHGEGFTMPMDEWDFHKLCAIMKGSGFLETKTAMLPLGPNQLLYIPPRVAHRFQDERGDPLTLVMVCFYDRAFGAHATALDVLSLFRQNFPALSPFSLTNNYSRLKFKNTFRAMLIEQLRRGEGSLAMLWCQLIELLIFLTRLHRERQKLPAADPRSLAFASSVYFIHNNFYRPIKVEELAAMANLSYRRYTEQFKRSTGKTVIEYLSEIRVEYAKRILAETEDIIYAAFESGFGDLTHFYRIFKKITGTTPKQFITRQKLPARQAG